MMWTLIILAVSLNDPMDIPGRVTLNFDTEVACKSAQATIDYKMKFKNYKIISVCQKN